MHPSCASTHIRAIRELLCADPHNRDWGARGPPPAPPGYGDRSGPYDRPGPSYGGAGYGDARGGHGGDARGPYDRNGTPLQCCARVVFAAMLYPMPHSMFRGLCALNMDSLLGVPRSAGPDSTAADPAMGSTEAHRRQATTTTCAAVTMRGARRLHLAWAAGPAMALTTAEARRGRRWTAATPRMGMVNHDSASLTVGSAVAPHMIARAPSTVHRRTKIRATLVARRGHPQPSP